MSSAAVESQSNRAFRFYSATIGKKALMAVTGVILFGFILGHLAGNLQVFVGKEDIDAYGAFLKNSTHGLIWVARATLLASVVLHIVSSIQLAKLQATARPVKYTKSGEKHSTYASRTMMWSGPIIGAFIVFHLLDLTFGTVNPQFREGHVYENILATFSRIPVAIAYIVAITMLCIHLSHGVYSMFQSLGFFHPRYTAAIRKFAIAFAFVIWAGYVSIPIAVMARLLPETGVIL